MLRRFREELVHEFNTIDLLHHFTKKLAAEFVVLCVFKHGGLGLSSKRWTIYGPIPTPRDIGF